MLTTLTPLAWDAHESCRRISDISTSSGIARRRRRRSATLCCDAGLCMKDLRRGELDVRVADLSVECRGLRALGRHEHEPACQDDDEQPWDGEHEGETPVDPVDHFAPPFGLKPAVTVNVSPLGQGRAARAAARAGDERHVREPGQAREPVEDERDLHVRGRDARRREARCARRRRSGRAASSEQAPWHQVPAASATARRGSAGRPVSAAPARRLRAAAPRRPASPRWSWPRSFAQPRRPGPPGAAQPWRRRLRPAPGRRRARRPCD